jgi:hypothetical protein
MKKSALDAAAGILVRERRNLALSNGNQPSQSFGIHVKEAQVG